jgi:hypothetical protein
LKKDLRSSDNLAKYLKLIVLKLSPFKNNNKGIKYKLNHSSYKTLSLVAILERIITLNHAWKISRDDFGASNPITLALRQQKSSWQATLIRAYPKQVYLKYDTDGIEDGEALFSVRVNPPITVNGFLRGDAEHLPERIAQSLFHPQELIELIK